jgi:hypothetical protein
LGFSTRRKLSVANPVEMLHSYNMSNATNAAELYRPVYLATGLDFDALGSGTRRHALRHLRSGKSVAYVARFVERAEARRDPHVSPWESMCKGS